MKPDTRGRFHRTVKYAAQHCVQDSMFFDFSAVCVCVLAGLIEYVLPLSGCVFSPLAVMKRRGESICFEVCS